MASAKTRMRGNDELVQSPAGFLLRYFRRHLVGHAVILASVFAGVGFSISSQYAVKHLVDVLMAGPSAPIWGAFALLAGLITADNLSWRVGGWSATRTFVRVTGDIRSDLFRHLTGHSTAYFADRQPGTLAGRITATANAIYQVESVFAWNVLPPCIAVCGAVLVMGLISPMIAGVLVLTSVSLGLLLVRLASSGRRLHHSYAADAAAVDGELVDVISNMPLVRAFGALGRERARFGSLLDREMKTRTTSLRYLERLRIVHAVTTALMTAGLLAWALMKWQQHAITTGDVVLTTTMGFTILHGTRDLALALVDCIQHFARLSEALTTLLVPHDMVDAPNAPRLTNPNGSVAFEGVSFAYGDGREVLHDFNLRIEAGERVGLVGRSGSGKSTLLALLQRIRDTEHGTIRISGQPIGQITQESLHSAISVVPQDVMLFHRSVMDNIRYGCPDATDEEVMAAAEAAGCDFIPLLENGWQTLVGDRGVKLSGGQRQRIAIARAFLRDAPILLLDEATSALDSESEMAVQRALDRLMTGRTVIAVAHRLSTLRNFDRIVVMQDGEIVQDGAPVVLERQEGLYRELLQRQAFSVGTGDTHHERV
ncbi:ABC transporter ATP-binding protein [Acidisphaera rubrifaciens]|uniref:ABC transporter multidrug resistance n=1 Tax=Acidisphaera rubrifaciens HS-AP3 TaxID=1231350 RepID=A0A0D6P5S7_9PROT|nr:ABC transporter ATP-binding protein [Acidisphaera rubrifaciens]GAN76681.1 ABC transporter multidrug resistance [Acidisphaera rubrifaciens HS-AP3]